MDNELLAQARQIFPNAELTDSTLCAPDECSALSDQTIEPKDERPAARAATAVVGSSLDIWTPNRPDVGPYVELHVSEFQPGYSESTVLIRPDQYRPTRPGTKRKAEEKRLRSEMSDDDRERSARRARKTVRHRIKQLNADRLLTLTSRRYMHDQERCFIALGEFNRLMKLRFKNWAYVAVPELHPKHGDHWHMHLAIRGYYPVDSVRTLWRQSLRNSFKECKLDHTPGNIDVRKREGRKHSLNALSRYLAKYITKAADSGWMHQKRYSFAGKMRPVKKVTLYADHASDLNIIRKVQELTDAALSRNPRWDVFGGFDCMMIETEPTSVKAA